MRVVGPAVLVLVLAGCGGEAAVTAPPPTPPVTTPTTATPASAADPAMAENPAGEGTPADCPSTRVDDYFDTQPLHPTHEAAATAFAGDEGPTVFVRAEGQTAEYTAAGPEGQRRLELLGLDGGWRVVAVYTCLTATEAQP